MTVRGGGPLPPRGTAARADEDGKQRRPSRCHDGGATGSLLAAPGPARQGRLAGDLGALLPGEFAGAGWAALLAAKSAELDGGRILAALDWGSRSGSGFLLGRGRRHCFAITRLVAA